jgi:hypothetical protein
MGENSRDDARAVETLQHAEPKPMQREQHQPLSNDALRLL